MASPNRSRSRLPARVYWFRRLLVLGTALALVFAVARLLDHGDDGAPAKASTVGVTAGRTPTPTALPTSRVTAKVTAKPTPTVVPPAQPDGPCATDEVTITPVEGTAPAGSTVPLVLQLTGIRPACTFQVNPQSVVARVSTSKGKVWSTQDCPSAVARTTVVVRSAAPTTIQVAWNGRSSDARCSRTTAWALPGAYQVAAAAIGSEPSTAAIRLTVPERPVVIKTVEPKKPKAPKNKQSTAPTTPDAGR